MSGSESFETSIAPWLAVSDAQEAVDFYRSALGAVEVDRLEDHGRVVVAQLSLAGAAFWVQGDPDASPDAPGVGTVRMILSVEDPGSVFDRAVVAGATVVAQVPPRARLANRTDHRPVRPRLGGQQTAPLVTGSTRTSAHAKNSFRTGASTFGSTSWPWPSRNRTCPSGSASASAVAVSRIHGKSAPPAMTMVGTLTEPASSVGIV